MNCIKLLLSGLLFVGFLASIISCKKEADSQTPQPKPVTTITGIDPATAPVGSTIAVNGTNFNTDPASNTVSIGGVPAVIVSATENQLIVIVPEGASNGPVSVTTGGQTAQSAVPFSVAEPPLKPVKEVWGTNFANLTWKKDTIYQIRGMMYIPADFMLTIEPGTIIEGTGPERDPTGQGMAGTLIVERRGKIIAKGTPTQPIVFTSAKPAGQRAPGDWGGLVLIGKAATNRPGDTPYAGGIRGKTETYWEFDDNSGTLEYVRIEFAGTSQPGVPNNKLNGLTLYGVGYNTILDHIQVSYSSNDAFAWYGGTVNARNLVAYRNFGDDWNTNWGYVGNVQFGVALRDPALGDPLGANGFDSQNFDPGENVGSPLAKQNGSPQTAPIFANMSNFAFSNTPTTGIYRAGMNLRRNTAISIYNSIIAGYPEGLRLDGTETGTLANLTSGTLDLKGIVLANVLTPIVGNGAITTDLATGYFSGTGRSNQIIQSADIASLLLNGANFNLDSPNFLPQSGSPLLTGAVTDTKLTNAFFSTVAYRGAFGTDNWTTGWTNFNPQGMEYR